MFEMKEVVGRSRKGFSEAVDKAVNEMIEKGYKPHFMEVVEQRGSLNENGIKEYQVKVKIAVEME